jgi:hypothetical protein
MSIDDTLGSVVKDQNEELNDARAEAIRELCQGRGILADQSDAEVSEEQLSLFDVASKDELVDLIERSLLVMSDDDQAVMRNALGKYDTRTTLTERRNRHIETAIELSRPISYRTLVRHEQEGARRLSATMMRLRESPLGTEGLGGRVTDLEVVVFGLHTLVERLLQMLTRKEDLDPDELRNALIVYGEIQNGAQLYDRAQLRMFERMVNLDYDVLRPSSESRRDQD